MPLNPNYAIGLDCYEGNGYFSPDLATKQADFFIAQCSRGTHIDALFKTYHDTCKQNEIPFGAYHYAFAYQPWKEQADRILGLIAGLDVSMIWWDYEPKGNVLNAKSAADAVSAMTYLRAQTGKLVGLYADRQRTFEIYRDAPASKVFPLWLANYRTDKVKWDSTPGIGPIYLPQFPNGVGWMLWQYGSEINWLGHDAGHEYGVESHSVDLNVYPGTKQELIAYLSLFPGNAGLLDTPTPQPMTIEERVTKLEAEARKHGWDI